MSILIKGMEMPQNCDKCRFQSAFKLYCDAMPYNFCGNTDDIERPDWCPLIELPPHGRLIDADEPMTKISTMMQEPDYQHEGENWMVGLIMARDAIDEAPTVIEGSEM